MTSDGPRELLIVALGAVCCFFLLHLGFVFTSFPRLTLDGVHRVDYITALAASVVCLVLVLRARTMHALLPLSVALTVVALLALDVKPCSQVRWAFVWCMVLNFYLALRCWSDGRGRFSAAILMMVLLFVLAQIPLLGAELILRWGERSQTASLLPCLSYGNTLWKQAELYDPEVNSRGLRERELPEFKPPGTWRCFFDGDSVTFGLGVPASQTLPRQFEDLANQTLGSGGMHYEGINGGWAGWNTDQEFEQLLKVGGFYEPDTVVLVWYPNDIEMGSVKYRMPLLPYCDELYENWLGYTYFEILTSLTLQNLGWRQSYLDFLKQHFENEPDYGVMKAYLYNMNVWCRHTHRQLVVVLFPFMEELGHYRLTAVHKQVQQTLTEYGVPCLDLLPVFAGRDEKTLQVNPRFDHHPNPAADHLAAEALLKFLVEQKLIPTAAAPAHS